LKSLNKLEFLVLNASDADPADFDDRGVAHLSKLRELRFLLIHSANVSDRGLESLKSLDRLADLSLFDTQVTQAGLEKFQKCMPNCHVELNLDRETLGY
jgi:hypothetical protein